MDYAPMRHGSAAVNVRATPSRQNRNPDPGDGPSLPQTDHAKNGADRQLASIGVVFGSKDSVMFVQSLWPGGSAERSGSIAPGWSGLANFSSLIVEHNQMVVLNLATAGQGISFSRWMALTS
eukprot:3938958-Rhodomonas_salina.3